MAFRRFAFGSSANLALFVPTILTIFLTGCLIPSVNTAFAGPVTVAWDPETSPVTGYKVYWGTASRSYSWVANAGAQSSYPVPGLNQGTTYYFAATAYDATGTQSGYSNEVAYTVPYTCAYTASPASQPFSAAGGPS